MKLKRPLNNRKRRSFPMFAIDNPTMSLFNGKFYDLTSAAHVGANEEHKVRPPSSRCGPGPFWYAPPPAVRLAGLLGGLSTSSDYVRADTSRLEV